jgi:hypothetical protein
LPQVTTVQLEFAWAAQLAQDPSVAAAALRVNDIVGALPKRHGGLVPIFINANSGQVTAL